MNKKIVFLLVFIFSCMFAYSQGNTLYNHSEIEYLSSFRIMGEIDLRTEKDVSAPVVYRTLNHEGANAAKAQALFVGKYGKKEFLKMQENFMRNTILQRHRKFLVRI